MSELLYLIGPPGAGKSTLCAWLTDPCGTGGLAQRPIRHMIWHGLSGSDVCELGYRRRGFAGTDSLSLGIQPQAVDFMRARMYGYVLGEGDRLANEKFFRACQLLRWNVRVVYLTLPPGEGERRRAERAERLGVPLQNEAWVRGRETKCARLADAWDAQRLDGTHPPEHLVTMLADQPLVRALRGI